MATQGKSLEQLLDERAKLHESNNGGSEPGAAGAALPPTMKKAKEVTADELLKELNRVPLFMTSLDETDGEDGENLELEALKALAYEGTRAEIAQNFREQGTELIQLEKRYAEAREYYTKAVHALHAPPPELDPEQGPSVVEIDEEAEAKKERELEEICYVNRALCNLQMQNYGSCARDCAAALRLNPKNVKAWYRAAQACLALDKLDEAMDASESGLKYDPDNASLKATVEKIKARQAHNDAAQKARQAREDAKRAKAATLKYALKARGIPVRTTERPPEIPEAEIELENPNDASTTLSFPTMFLYPLNAQTDFIKAFREDESVGQHLSYIFPLPWDEAHEYTPESVECYMETMEGGLIKAGKKMSLARLLSSGKVEVVDGLVRVTVVPKAKATTWIEEFKLTRGKK